MMRGMSVMKTIKYKNLISKIKKITENKEGEGSRGGKIIGHTKSGEPIYASSMIRKEYHGQGPKYSLPSGTSNDEAETIHHAISSYHHVLKPGKHSYKDFADSIAKHYDINEPRNKAIHHTLMKAHDRTQNMGESKEGEGSRGGKVIGHTKSGKPIYVSSHKDKSFFTLTPKEHDEAAGLHSKRAAYHNGEADKYKFANMKKQEAFHRKMVSKHAAANHAHWEMGEEHTKGKSFVKRDGKPQNIKDIMPGVVDKIIKNKGTKE